MGGPIGQEEAAADDEDGEEASCATSSVPSGANVFLNVYDIVPAVNKCSRALCRSRWGIYHTGVEVQGLEFSFGGHSDSSTGVFCAKPRSAQGCVFRQQLPIGHVELDALELRQTIAEISKGWPGNGYDPFQRNCNHFSESLCKELTGHKTPSYINSFTQSRFVRGVFYRCLVPLGKCLEKFSYEQGGITYSNNEETATESTSLGISGANGINEVLVAAATMQKEKANRSFKAGAYQEAREARGVARAQLGMHEEAVADLRRALQLTDPADAGTVRDVRREIDRVRGLVEGQKSREREMAKSTFDRVNVSTNTEFQMNLKAEKFAPAAHCPRADVHCGSSILGDHGQPLRDDASANAYACADTNSLSDPSAGVHTDTASPRAYTSAHAYASSHSAHHPHRQPTVADTDSMAWKELRAEQQECAAADEFSHEPDREARVGADKCTHTDSFDDLSGTMDPPTTATTPPSASPRTQGAVTLDAFAEAVCAGTAEIYALEPMARVAEVNQAVDIAFSALCFLSVRCALLRIARTEGWADDNWYGAVIGLSTLFPGQLIMEILSLPFLSRRSGPTSTADSTATFAQLFRGQLRRCSREDYAGLHVAVDAQALLSVGLSAYALKLAQDPSSTAHIAYCTRRALLLREWGAECVFVLAGDDEGDHGQERREEQRREGLRRLGAGDRGGAHRCFARALRATPEMAAALARELEEMGVRCITAPGSAAAQAAFLTAMGPSAVTSTRACPRPGRRRCWAALGRSWGCRATATARRSACRRPSASTRWRSSRPASLSPDPDRPGRLSL
ncbi:unnamed protein product [Prorocentrum cordatum]|uniref:PPPDE domain-containing protein n=1 Tax=Prorocentrum cordatum TaxID=2364126 RepID=A0ABN9WHB1_9DINO|nr:unnamed protein product [Polarella glacialis]